MTNVYTKKIYQYALKKNKWLPITDSLFGMDILIKLIFRKTGGVDRFTGLNFQEINPPVQIGNIDLSRTRLLFQYTAGNTDHFNLLHVINTPNVQHICNRVRINRKFSI